MQMQQIHYFLTLCEELSFTRAARRCGVAQPSLTTAMCAGAGAGRRAVSPKACHRVDRARAQGAALPRRNRAQRRWRPRGCTDVDAASGRRPISPSSSGQFAAPVELMPLTLGGSLHKGAAVTRSSILAQRCANVRTPQPEGTSAGFRGNGTSADTA